MSRMINSRQSEWRASSLAMLFVLVTAIASDISAEDAIAGNSAQSISDRMAWFQNSRFGMFIHWGVYAVPAGEWNGRTDLAEWFQLQANMPTAEYAKYIDEFDPVDFDAKAWVKVAKDAGMKYMVVTAKHHDGFCMWPTKLSQWSIRQTPWWQRTKRDPLKELSKACQEAGLVFCLYYSLPDWHHPDFPARYSQTNSKGNPNAFHGDPQAEADLDKYVDYMKGQLKELLTDYGPIGILWFDGGGSFKGKNVDRAELLHATEIVELIHTLQPNCLVNNRLSDDLGDYSTPEQKIPGSSQSQAFEVCMTLNRHWGYNKADNDWKEPDEVIHKLVDIASKGGNFLLNVGPMANGAFPPDATRILGEVGSWMQLNGESIYGTTASPWKAFDWGRCTVRERADGTTLYLHVFDWPTDGQLQVQGIGNEVEEAFLLADANRLPARKGSSGITLSLPKAAPDQIDSVVVLKLHEPLRLEDSTVDNQSTPGK